MEKEGLIKMDRFKGTFLLGLILEYRNQPIDIFDNPYISLKFGKAVTGWELLPIDSISLRNCTEEEGIILIGKYWYHNTMGAQYICIDQIRNLEIMSSWR